MTRARLLLFGVVFLLLLIGLSVGAWWYLFGANKVQAAELLPTGTIALATIPNGATVIEGYESCQVKTLLDSPNAKPWLDTVVNWIGQKNVDLITAFLPNLSGQSFVAVTHFDYDHPEKIGLIAAMKPKVGMGDFGSFLEKLKTTWPDMVKQGKTGKGSVAGVEYEWIQGPGAPDKICVAQIKGWIVTSWGEASLQDWIERFEKKSTTPSLAEDTDYRTSLSRVGDDPMTLLYVNYHAFVGIFQKQMEKTNPATANYLAKRLESLGGAALATRFENGEIVDRFSFVIPRAAQLDSAMTADPCPFDTLKFTGPDTRFYWAGNINWKQYYKNLNERFGPSVAKNVTTNPVAKNFLDFAQTWSQGAGIDFQHNIVDALGSEFSIQVEWSQDATWPEVGLFVKMDKPDDFKPTIKAIVESVRKAYATSAVINEINLNGQNFAALKFVPTGIISPTITEDGPYLGVFLTENQAVRSFQRDASIGLLHNANFSRQVGDKRNGAAQVFFLDSPYLLDHGYRTAMPYLSFAGMFSKDFAAMLKGKNMPPDLTWLAPMGTWSCVITPDDAGIQVYSVSGIGNQGILLAGALGGTTTLMQNMGYLPKPAPPAGSLSPTTPVNTPDATTNSAPATNSIPTNSNSDATPPTPVPAQTK